MPYTSLENANPAVKGIKPPVTLAQANMIARWADSIEEKGEADNPWATAIALFKRTHHVESGKWVKNKETEAEHSLDKLVEALLDAGFAVSTSSDDLDGDLFQGEPAYVVDLCNDVPQKDGRPDFSQPFRILPAGILYRYGKREVTPTDIAEFEDNWHKRSERGIRRKRIVIDAEHNTGGIGWYTEIAGRGDDGLWARIALSANGKKLLGERDFYFFSPTVAWEMQDRQTGNIVRNQIVGGALTNHPVFGDATALPVYSEAAVERLRDLYQDIDPIPPSIKHLFSQKGDPPMTAKLTTDDLTIINQVAAMFNRLLKKGGDDVKDKGDPPIVEVTAEQFADLQKSLSTLTDQVKTLSTERDALKTQVETGQTQLAQETHARVLQEMKQFVQTYSHLALPVELPDDAPEGSMTAQSHFAWLQNVDVTDDQTHWKFFNAVLLSANAALAEVAEFDELGASHGANLSDDEELDKKARAYAAEHDVNYVVALKAVAAGA